jgi:hypothetical protein
MLSMAPQHSTVAAEAMLTLRENRRVLAQLDASQR